MSDGETKKCPQCAETIQAAAIKCRYCGSSLPAELSLAETDRPVQVAGANSVPFWHWLLPVNFLRAPWWSVAEPARLFGVEENLQPLGATLYAVAVGVVYTFVTHVFATNIGLAAAGLGPADAGDYVGGFVSSAGQVARHAFDGILLGALPAAGVAYAVLRVRGQRRRFAQVYCVGCYSTWPLFLMAVSQADWALVVAVVGVLALTVRGAGFVPGTV